jgi:hypothetical protein
MILVCYLSCTCFHFLVIVFLVLCLEAYEGGDVSSLVYRLYSRVWQAVVKGIQYEFRLVVAHQYGECRQ